MTDDLTTIRDYRFFALSDDVILEFLSLILVQPDGHWGWAGPIFEKDTRSYPQFTTGGKTYQVRHIILDFYVRDPVDSETGNSPYTRTHCGRQSCINPDHFRVVDYRSHGRPAKDKPERPQSRRMVERAEKKKADRRKHSYLKPECPNGHKYEPDNFFIRRRTLADGTIQQYRTCLTCYNATQAVASKLLLTRKKTTGYRDGGNWKLRARSFLDSV